MMKRNGGILGAAGRPMVAFGGQNAYKTFKKGDVTVSLQWVQLNDWDEMPEPCMCLYRSNSSRLVQKQSGGAYVIPQNKACMYVDSKTGQPTKSLIAGASSAAIHMGFYPDQMTCFRIADAIVEAIPDLLYMPDVPPPKQEAELFAKPISGIEVTIRDAGQVVAQGVA